MIKLIKKVMSLLGLLFVIFVLFIAVLNYFSNPVKRSLFGYRGYTVISGSMEPTLSLGDYIITKEHDFDHLKEGDVISFENGQTIVTHRIEKTLPDGRLITRGDANRIDDQLAVGEAEYIGRMRFRIPYLGKIMIWLQEPIIFGIVMALIATRLLIAIFFYSKKESRETNTH